MATSDQKKRHPLFPKRQVCLNLPDHLLEIIDHFSSEKSISRSLAVELMLDSSLARPSDQTKGCGTEV